MQGSKDIRATTSCSECQRRKQKCSREWPCNHCQARKVPHLCQFGQRKGWKESSTESPPELRGQKRSNADSNKESPPFRYVSSEGGQDGLRAWGYMPGHVHFTLGRASLEDSASSATQVRPQQSQEVEKVLYTIPTRTLTDAIINHFLNHVNSRYNSIYAPTFTDQYVQWWFDRINGSGLSPVFTCLLLRVCAYSVQYLTSELRKTIEFELACNIQVLTERFYRAAEQLSCTFTASNTSLERVQELFLKGAWLKSDSQIVESWHSLGSAIREAQELGLDRDVGIAGLSEFDIEIRRRLWTLLFIWDWQMSAWLGRPHLIDQKDTTFVFPNLRLEESKSQPNLLSPFAHIALQAHLARRVAKQMGNVLNIVDLSTKDVLAVLAECETFIDELPPVFRIDNPDTSLDEEHPYYVLQRRQLHVVIWMTMVDPLKPYLTRSPDQKASSYDIKFRDRGIDLSLKLLKAARLLFDHEFPINSRFHLVIFCVFDTATILCSAIIHDTSDRFPHREEVMGAVETSLEMLHQLSPTSRIGASSYKFLFNLVQATPLLLRSSRSQKRQKTNCSKTPETQLTPPSDPPAQTILKPVNTMMDGIPEISTTDDLSFDLDQFLLQNPFENSNQLDIGGMEQIWDWDTLNLDAYFKQSEGV
ncbi:uncharacterized protein BDR25DRAFT_260304 [Lindgomyces ingoldianus]|uniref:Uncharacterized protein n=1 Tax=Lindgomyces ingoldianus TaxID=673940 RepID=A0ACB6QXZ6_9PLEO|nr:uncharacterized protein BDR25DRAFT_260304 [Lindgomyces ingoldianus]KAF2471761.1 hypothetical protein BDR25DRAFT_260304 [Lindgomyces ingoldianus]